MILLIIRRVDRVQEQPKTTNFISCWFYKNVSYNKRRHTYKNTTVIKIIDVLASTSDNT